MGFGSPANSGLWPHLEDLVPETAGVTSNGVLTIGDCRVDDLAAEFGTPAYIFDETGLRRQARRYLDGLRRRRPKSEVLFASKSLPCVAMYALAAAEGISIDVAGQGELVMALAAGVDPATIYLHGNAKTDAELTLAHQAGVGAVIIDNFDELDRIAAIVRGPQTVMVRINPGISPDTHDSQNTGSVTSKFGFALGRVEDAVRKIEGHPLLQMAGVHTHIGSQILDTLPFATSVKAISAFGDFSRYDVGGGLGVRYTRDQPAPSIDDYLDEIVTSASMYLPDDATLMIEPGRSLVARSGVTLYRVNSVKADVKTFVAIDGGMADNLDIALTGQAYEACLPLKMTVEPDTVCDVVGRQCESGDLMVSGATLPDPQPNDLLLMPVTGAYSYTMSNHYNGAVCPPIVFCKDGDAVLAARRETYDDLLATHEPAFNRSWS